MPRRYRSRSRSSIATDTVLPGFAFVAVAWGFSTVNLPLGAVLPQGQPGCNLLVNPDRIERTIPTAGVASTRLQIPSTPSLAGLADYEQLVPLEVNASRQFVAITATNALQLVVGTFE